MKILKIILSLVGIFWSVTVISQNISLPKDGKALQIKAAAYEQGVSLQWTPVNASVWDTLRKVGYVVDRVEIDKSGNPLGAIILVRTVPILPFDSLAFEQGKQAGGGELIGAIGALLYDSTFQFAANDLLDPIEMKYNYIVYEAKDNPIIALATGMLFPDSTVTQGKTYRYTVKGATSDTDSIFGTVDIKVEAGEFVVSPEDLILEFKFPDDLSLSTMIMRANPVTVPQVVGLARAYGDSIIVKWAPNTVKLWQQAQKDGYIVVRTEEGSNAPVDTLGVVLPMQMEEMKEAEIMADSFAVLALSTMYNENNPGNSMGGFDTKAKGYETMHGFALFCAEKSSLAARILGFQYIDKNVEPDKKYVYLISTPGAAETLLGTAIISIENKKEELPLPIGFKAFSMEKTIQLQWDKYQNKIYSSWDVERSDDGGATFKKLNNSPLVFAENDEVDIPFFGFTDSVGMNYKKFTYQLKGHNSFAETSPPAEVIEMARDFTSPPFPSMDLGEYRDSVNGVDLKWHNVEEMPSDFGGYIVEMGFNEEGPFKPISEILPANTTEYRYSPDSLLSGDKSHYFQIVAIDTAGNRGSSFSKYVNVPDLIAPDSPTDFEGEILENGLVRLNWKPSPSLDVTGYWIYFANDTTAEFTILNEEAIELLEFQYEIESTSLNKEIYFMINAEDDNSNRGFRSDILTLKRPDKVPPVRPIILSATEEELGINLKWEKSISDDVSFYLIYKRVSQRDSAEYVFADSLAANITSFFDNEISLDSLYDYKISVVDDSGNQSEYTMPVTGKLPYSDEMAKVNFKPEISKEKDKIALNWDFEITNGLDKTPFTIQIYRSTGNNNVEIVEADFEDLERFFDLKIQQNVLYNYAAQIKFDDGRLGKLSDVKSVLFR